MFCEKCGAKIKNDALFCYNCGSKVAAYDDTSTVTEPDYDVADTQTQKSEIEKQANVSTDKTLKIDTMEQESSKEKHAANKKSWFIILFAIVAISIAATFILINKNDANNISISSVERENAGDTNTNSAEEQKVTAATEEKKDILDSDTIYWTYGYEINSLDPGLMPYFDFNISNQLFEGLTREVDGEILPGIAESWDISDDGLTYTFYLRKSNWSDGSPLTAYDFEYAWKRSMNPANNSQYDWVWYFSHIENVGSILDGTQPVDNLGIEVKDIYTLEVKLEQRVDCFLNYVSMVPLSPVKKDAASQNNWSLSPEKFVSNGPFVLSMYDDEMLLIKNDEYWNKNSVNINQIRIKFTGEDYQNYQDGNIDIMEGLSDNTIKTAKSDRYSEVVEYPLFIVDYIRFNFNKDRLTEKLELRQAISYAIDNELIANIYEELTPAAGVAPYGFVDYYGNDFAEISSSRGAEKIFHVDHAQQQLETAGDFAGSEVPEIELVVLYDDYFMFIAELVKQMLEDNLDLNIRIESLYYDDYEEVLISGEYDMIIEDRRCDFFDPMGILEVFSTGYYNNPTFSNSKYDNACRSSKSTTDTEKHYDYMYEAHDILMSEFAIVPLVYRSKTYLLSKSITDVGMSSMGVIDLTNANIDR